MSSRPSRGRREARGSAAREPTKEAPCGPGRRRKTTSALAIRARTTTEADRPLAGLPGGAAQSSSKTALGARDLEKGSRRTAAPSGSPAPTRHRPRSRRYARFAYGGDVATRPVVLRNGLEIEDPLAVVLGFLEAYPSADVSGRPRPGSFGEADLRLANRGGARISAVEIASILARRRASERALALVRGYKRDLDLNRGALRAMQKKLARRNYVLTEVRILDLLIWSVQ